MSIVIVVDIDTLLASLIKDINYKFDMTTFPTTESTLSAIHLGQFLKQKYNLSSKTICKLFRTGMNHLYLVTDGESKFALRIYTFNWRTKLEISEELRLLIHLKNNKLPITYPIGDCEGKLIQEFNAPEGIRYGVLFSYAEGQKTARFTPKTSYHIGIILAKIHQVSENFELDRMTYNSKTLLTDSLRRTKSFFTANSNEMAFIEKTTYYLVEEYKKVNTNHVRQGALHLDVWFDNMHFNGESRVTIFDFDFCGNGWLCHDISYFLYQLYSTHNDNTEYEFKARSFLKGYDEVIKIGDEEKRIMPITCLAVMLFYISMQCDRYDTWSNIFLNEDHLKRFTWTLKKWIEYNRIDVR
ncbi:MAG: phosphotransferase [Cytophagales bacterium]|nr:phosphotransferase [Cytophagales bacterium]